jgi:hypothetical protein
MLNQRGNGIGELQKKIKNRLRNMNNHAIKTRLSFVFISFPLHSGIKTL